jgi:hypothetical protein
MKSNNQDAETSHDDVADNSTVSYSSLGTFKDYYAAVKKKSKGCKLSAVFISTAENQLLTVLTVMRMGLKNSTDVMNRIGSSDVFPNVVKDHKFLKQNADGSYDFDDSKLLAIYGEYDVMFSTYSVNDSKEKVYSIIIQKLDRPVDALKVDGFMVCSVAYLNRAVYDTGDPDMQSIRTSLLPLGIYKTKEDAMSFAAGRPDQYTAIAPVKNGLCDNDNMQVWYMRPWGGLELEEGVDDDGDDEDASGDESDGTAVDVDDQDSPDMDDPTSGEGKW